MISRRLTLAAGAALILLANGIALTGVAYNRSGDPESRVVLSERELGRPWAWRGHKENSGLSLQLSWRVIDPSIDATYDGYYGGQGKTPGWLDEKRMTEMGFDPALAKRGKGHGYKNAGDAERQVLVVLELAGPEWQRVVERLREQVAHRASLRQASPDAKERVEAEKRAQENLAREENVNSRLFAVDAGDDLPALREKYPDRRRFMIVKANLRPYVANRNGQSILTGFLGPLAVSEINVPHALRPALEALPPNDPGPAGKKARFTAVVAVGNRLEPWIEAVDVP